MAVSNREVDGMARIKVIGVGGGGSNAVSRMFRERVPSVEYMVVNTDAQALVRCDVPLKIRVGDQLTGGKGVGGNPDLGMKSAEESREELYDAVRDADMIFVAAGMGGGTGTG
ncbi:MAG: cell division protein FtsZ, partial [Chloroflexi bacterium]|nr:cell division protein FtsZ [Chloroflexota bacterium]